MKKLLLIGLLSYGTAAFASSTLLEVPVTYHPDAGVVEKVKQECQIENMLQHRVGPVLAKLNKGGDGTIATGADSAGATLLRLQITHVLGVGGGAFSGPKAITVNADLLDSSGKVLRHTKINRWSMGGMFGAFKGTCTILDRSAAAIGKDLSRWVHDPSYQIVNEAEPKEAEAAAVAAPEVTPEKTQ
ncbi:hypothetical protein BCF11_5140 [Collimonas sp. PA-H2]|uniref:hypothetical protein n=1 Tax=Collimonas sp. PA-H2 TaxID=1881062 RepID=UPI000BF7553B|nr:hypothetical protein [Collimonas sp. PA-H2]PFH04365.1 hypothetical protein BCF11_5140 [Collimonas sp. PA-H2]